MSLSVRPPAVAGAFYPADPAVLAQEVATLLRAVPPTAAPPLAVVSPHAGYAYSGKLMARALAATRDARPDVIVILSPSHRHAFDGVAAPSDAAFAVPGATVPVAVDLVTSLVAKGLVHVEDAAHDREHGIEVQLPVLRAVHPGVPILPLVLGRGGDALAAQIVDAVMGETQAPLFVLSSDLSHFEPLAEATRHDAETARRFETGDASLGGRDACGAAALTGYLRSRVAEGGRVVRLGMANSATVTGDESRTVGYGAWALCGATQPCLPEGARRELLRLARQALTSRLDRGKAPQINVGSFNPLLQTYAASFVTLEQAGRLRGCIGSLVAHRPLVEDVAINVQKSAFDDPRFRPFKAEELANTQIKIAVLSPPGPLQVSDQADLEARLVPGRDGLILRDQGRSGTFLPMVWEKLPDPHAFVQALKRKAGLPPDHWSATLRVERFCAESFAEG